MLQPVYSSAALFKDLSNSVPRAKCEVSFSPRLGRHFKLSLPCLLCFTCLDFRLWDHRGWDHRTSDGNQRRAREAPRQGWTESTFRYYVYNLAEGHVEFSRRARHNWSLWRFCSEKKNKITIQCGVMEACYFGPRRALGKLQYGRTRESLMVWCNSVTHCPSFQQGTCLRSGSRCGAPQRNPQRLKLIASIILL